MLRWIADVCRVHLARAVGVFRREHELAIFRPEQITDAIVGLEKLLRASSRERCFRDIQVIVTRLPASAATTARLWLVRRAVSLRPARRRPLQLQVVQSLAVSH